MRACLAGAGLLAAGAAAAAAGLLGCGGGGDVARTDTTAPPHRVTPPTPSEGPVRLEKGLAGDATVVALLSRQTLARSAPRASAPAWLQIPAAAPYSGRPARFMVTGGYRDARGAEWVRVQLATRPNGTTAWVPRRDVRLSATHYRVRVDLSARRLDLYRDGRLVARHRAGVGMAAYPTPMGLFAIEDMLPSAPDWRPKYGGYVLTLTAFSNVLTSFMGGEGQSAIHGTGTLGKVGRAASFGCVVLDADALRDLYRRVRPGTPVEIVA
jgi:lipoprotein-anchoring transpeptidase ErfK/SrfK